METPSHPDGVSVRAKKFDDIQDAIKEVHYRFTCFSRTDDALNRAHHLIELANAVSDLASWHDSYDGDTGTLSWERAED